MYAAALFGSIPFIVEPKCLGTAFGIRSAAENTGLFLTPLCVGEILGKSQHNGQPDYTYALSLLSLIAFVSLLLGIWIFVAFS